MSELKTTYCFMDESGTTPESPILSLSLVVTDNPDAIRTECLALLDEIRRDPEMSNHLGSIRDKGINHFHHTSDHIEIKTPFFKLIKGLTFDAYLIFARKDELPIDFDKTSVLLKLFTSLLYDRVQEHYYKNIEIVYERFDDGSPRVEALFRAEAQRIHTEILALKAPKQAGAITVSFNNKQERCLWVSDYICGAFLAYVIKIVEGKWKDSPQERQFLSISGKFRVIHDLTRRKFYTRQNEPFTADAYKS